MLFIKKSSCDGMSGWIDEWMNEWTCECTFRSAIKKFVWTKSQNVKLGGKRDWKESWDETICWFIMKDKLNGVEFTDE